jgi:hypothetical protein
VKKRMMMPADYLAPVAEFRDGEMLRGNIGGTRVFAAERGGTIGTPFGCNIDDSLFLDFDAEGRLAVIEVLAAVRSTPLKRPMPPYQFQRAALRLAKTRSAPGSEHFDATVATCIGASEETYIVQSSVMSVTDDATWYSLGPDVHVALADGRLSSVLLCYDVNVVRLANALS